MRSNQTTTIKLNKPATAKPIIPPSSLLAEPLKGAIGLVVAVLIGFTEAKVVAPVGPYPSGAMGPVGYAAAGAGLPAASPTLRILLEPAGELAVVKCTWGKVAAVLRREVV